MSWAGIQRAWWVRVERCSCQNFLPCDVALAALWRGDGAGLVSDRDGDRVANLGGGGDMLVKNNFFADVAQHAWAGVAVDLHNSGTNGQDDQHGDDRDDQNCRRETGRLHFVTRLYSFGVP